MSSLGGPSVATEVAALFRTRRVSDIRAIESSVRTEVDEKSTELQSLLGTRYRELILAADSVTEISQTAREVSASLQTLAASSSTLRTSLLTAARASHSRSNSASPEDELSQRKEVHLVGSHLKLLVDTPEALYLLLEEKRVYRAAVRFAAADGACRALEDHSLRKVAAGFIANQWKTVEDSFKEQIVHAASTIITEGASLSDPAILGGAAAALLAIDRRPAKIVLEDILNSTTDEVTRIFGQQAFSTGVDLSPDFVSSARAIVSTLCNLYTIFVETIDDQTSIQKLVQPLDGELAGQCLQFFSKENLRQQCSIWLETLRSTIESKTTGALAVVPRGALLLQLVVSVEQVVLVGQTEGTDKAADQNTGDRWLLACETVLGIEPQAVVNLFIPSIISRAEGIADEWVRNAVEKVEIALNNFWQILSGSEERQSGLSLESSKKRLGRDSSVFGITEEFEKQLGLAMKDMIDIQCRLPKVAESFRRSLGAQTPHIIELLRKAIPPLSGSKTAVPKRTRNGVGTGFLLATEYHADVEKILFIARVSAAIESASVFPKAFVFGLKESEFSDSSYLSLKSFQESCSAISISAYDAWALWVASLIADRLSAELLAEEESSCFGHRYGWAGQRPNEATAPEIGNSSGEELWPTCCSVAALEFAMDGCSAASYAGGYSLPPHALRSLRRELCTHYLAVYEKGVSHFATLGNTGLCVSLQIVFDVRFLGLVLGEANAEGVTTLLQKAEDLVDPIDYSACRKGLESSVRIYVERSRLLLGVLASSQARNSASTNVGGVSTTGHFESASLLPLASSAARFHFLPAPTPALYSGRGGAGPAAISSRATLHAMEMDASNQLNPAGSGESSVVDLLGSKVGSFSSKFFSSLSGK